MTIAYPFTSIPYEQLTDLFIKKSEGLYILQPSIGNGSVEIFRLARGMEARFWNCNFNQEIELYCQVSPEIRNRYFTLVCFLDTSGLRIYSSDTSLTQNFVWNTMFISAKSNYKMYIPPSTNGQCISISFTKTWLHQNILEKNAAFHHLKEQVKTIDNFSLLGEMNASQKKMVAELLNASWKKSFGTFYIKSSVLKIISDFLYKIRERDSAGIHHLCLEKEVPQLRKLTE